VLLQHTKALGENPLTQRQLTLRARGKQRDVYTYIIIIIITIYNDITTIHETSHKLPDYCAAF
jgi:hypothetical protein